MLYGERVRLRQIEREDIPTFVRWFNDPEVRQFLVMYEPMSRAKEERWFAAQLERRDEFLYAIEAQVDGSWVHIGNLGLHRVDWKNRTAVFGIVLGEKAYWGQGYGSEAARVLLRFAFQELNLHRVELEVFAFNARAIRCYEKAGFRHEGTRRHAFFRDGRYHDVHVMSILREEFLAEERGSGRR
ncbi:MAG: GNAT family N-acetyltransferase [Candidatus Acetothermia bacterium]|jgi:RimJ/RimL family protein N-acetyltransferase|nr:GNAT family N-acetyltransferase [Candidatus Acetothermia bacterium]